MKIIITQNIKTWKFYCTKISRYTAYYSCLDTHTELSHYSTYWGGLSSSLYTQAVSSSGGQWKIQSFCLCEACFLQKAVHRSA